jgi:Tfp pilus assembly protein PilO
MKAAWSIKRMLFKLRWPGIVGLALLGFAVGLMLFGVEASRQRLSALDREASAVKSQLAKRGGTQVLTTSRSQLSNFYAFFPLTENVPELLSRIHGSAKEHGLLLEKGEYKLARESNFRLARYQVTLPVHGDYGSVRSFANDVLEAVPSAALEELTLKRESVDLPELDGRVRFVLFLGAQQ